MTIPCIALDGVTSFTGYWFARTLAEQGFQVVAFCRQPRGEYHDLKAERLQRLPAGVRLVDEAPVGSARHLEALAALPSLAVYGRHGAYTENYKSADFAWLRAVEENTRGLTPLLALLQERRAKLCLTGSVFQQGVGVAYPTPRAFSPYGLSKTLTEQAIAYHAEATGVPLGIFVIANPFGPWEEARFTSYLARSWLAGQTPQVRTPLYVRDNIPVGLLALAYVRYLRQLMAGVNPPRFGPSCHAESQGQFTARFAQALRPRLGVPCAFTCADHQSFDEPLLRLNTDVLDYPSLGWEEAAGWDALAEHYLRRFAGKNG